MRLYFAYGSNMSPQQMAWRCPGARPVGRAVLRDWRFHANTRGSASIMRRQGSEVHGVLWRCNAAHIHALDRYEGISWGNYRRRHKTVFLPCETPVAAIVYEGTRTYDGQARVRYMHTAVLPGALHFALPDKYIEELRTWLPRRPIGEKRAPVRGRPRAIRFPV